MIHLHFICPQGRNHRDLGQGRFESGNWVVSESRANEAVGGKLFLHEGKKVRSWHGGTIESWRPFDGKRKIFTYRKVIKFEVLCPGPWGQEQATVRFAAIDDVTDALSVFRAIVEYEAEGQAAFLRKYGFGPSRDWMLRMDDGREFDAKAILGAAHGHQHPSIGPLTADQFHGGEPTARRLRALGFTVTEPSASRNPVWSRDELILALDLCVRHRPLFPNDKHPDVIALSELLNRLGALTDALRVAKFRNPNAVAMKLQNFRRLDPDQGGKGLPGGGRGEEEVWSTFFHDPLRLRQTAKAIQEAVTVQEVGASVPPAPEDGEEAEEGRILTRLHRTRERDRRIVERKKAQALREHGTLRCEACSFDFSARYGHRGSGFIECHHTKPVSALSAGEKTMLQDLALLCANCHRMVHAARPWLSIAALKAIITL